MSATSAAAAAASPNGPASSSPSPSSKSLLALPTAFSAASTVKAPLFSPAPPAATATATTKSVTSSSSSSPAAGHSSNLSPRSAAAALALSASLSALGGGRILKDRLGYPIYENGSLVPPSHLHGSTLARSSAASFVVRRGSKKTLPLGAATADAASSSTSFTSSLPFPTSRQRARSANNLFSRRGQAESDRASGVASRLDFDEASREPSTTDAPSGDASATTANSSGAAGGVTGHASSAPTRRHRNYVLENIRDAKETLRVNHKLPPKVHIRAELPKEVFGEDYKLRPYKSQKQQSTERTQRFMETFRASVARAQELHEPVGNTSRDVYAPHFRDLWFPVLQPNVPEEDSPLRRSYDLSGGLRTTRVKWRAGNRRKRHLQRVNHNQPRDNRLPEREFSRPPAAGSVTSFNQALELSMSAAAKVPSQLTASNGSADEDWKTAMHEAESEKNEREDDQSTFLTEAPPLLACPPTRTEATQQLYSFFDRVIRVGHNFLHLKAALRERDLEKVGFVSWEDFIVVLEALHWQFTDQERLRFKVLLEATRIVKPGFASGSPSSSRQSSRNSHPQSAHEVGAKKRWVVDYISFVLSIRSWQRERGVSQSRQRVAEGSHPRSSHSTGHGAQGNDLPQGGPSPSLLRPLQQQVSHTQTRARSTPTRVRPHRSPNRLNGKHRGSGRRGRKLRPVGITDPSYRIDPVLESMLGTRS